MIHMHDVLEEVMQEKEVCRPHAGQFLFGKKVSRPLSLGQLLALQQAVGTLTPHLPVPAGRG